jgi:hypothetical protein
MQRFILLLLCFFCTIHVFCQPKHNIYNHKHFKLIELNVRINNTTGIQRHIEKII